MALIKDGYFQDTYWGSRYWQEDYWPEYGAPAATPVPRFFGKSPIPRDRSRLWQLVKRYLENKQCQ